MVTLHDGPIRGTLVTDLLSGRPCVRRVVLRVVEGQDRGEEVEIGELSVLVGSHPDTELTLTDPMVSRQHLEVRLVDDGVEVRDLGSKNGTWLGESRIERTIVAPGSRIRVGSTQLGIDALDEPMDLGEGLERFGALHTRSHRMREVFALLDRIAKSDASVLLEGETGVGKDVLARTIHAESNRAHGPFLVLDCGSVSRELIASELFGHKKGAFTGAITDRAGLFEAARGGTVFLDELGELASDLQPSLLRVLENRQVTRLGDTQARDVDVRVIAATNRSLRDEVRAGRFREDLFFRLAVVSVLIPPLRERPEDIPALADLFLSTQGRTGQLSASDARKLTADPWPGNVRELKNVIERSALLSGDRLRVQMPIRDGAGRPLPAAARKPMPRTQALASGGGRSDEVSIPIGDLVPLPFKEAKSEALARFERSYLEARLVETGGNVSRVASEVGLARAYVHRLLTRHGIDRHKSRADGGSE
jgi:DNA-binding NtrC family response regulator